MRVSDSSRRKFTKFRVFSLFLYLLVLVVALDGLYVWHIWPDWKLIGKGHIPKSAFIREYEQLKAKNHKLPSLRWHPISKKLVPRHIIRAVIAAEDSHFYSHKGFDIQAISNAMKVNLKNLNFKYGASTISQQTTKNLFLSASKNPLRKWHEVILTLAMENKISKRQIVHLYLNVAEFGRGIFGIEAASRFYWGKSARWLSTKQAAELAATLPSPKKHNPHTRSKAFLKRYRRVARYLHLHR